MPRANKCPSDPRDGLVRIEPWSVTENGRRPDLDDHHAVVFTLANGRLGARGGAEEGAPWGSDLRRCYAAGVYGHFPAPHEWPRAGFARRCCNMVPVMDWLGLRFRVGRHRLDLSTGAVTDYARSLDLRRGVLSRAFTWTDPEGRRTRFEFVRFLSLAREAVAAIRCTVTPLGHRAAVTVRAELNGASAAEPATWTAGEARGLGAGAALLSEQVSTSGIAVAAAMGLRLDGKAAGRCVTGGGGVALEASLPAGRPCTVDKTVAVCTSRDPAAKGSPATRAAAGLRSALSAGFEHLIGCHEAAWARIWEDRDVVVEGDDAAQQGIRFQVFQMEQVYTGSDDTLNIGARALSGPDHKGHYFWDTEAYMVPYFVWQAPEKARALLTQRHRTLPQAVERAREHGYRGAMFPWAAMDGTESALPWEYAQLQVHVNAAVPYAVWLYMEATGDLDFLATRGAELLVQSCRFWADRSFFGRDGSCRITCVTGPDEYTVAVDNDHYTNAMVRFVFRKAVALLDLLRRRDPAAWRRLAKVLSLLPAEPRDWLRRAEAMRIPYDRKSGIFPQHENFLDMQPVDLAAFPEKWKPAFAKCPWERIIRLQMIKQPDVLLAMHLLAEEYTAGQMRANFDFYDPKTLHESSLGACTHSIVAGAIGRHAEAFGFYLRGARLDLDQPWTRGIRIANAAGAWQVITQGFAGLRLSVRDGALSLDPRLPRAWKALSFSLRYRGRRLAVRITRDAVELDNDGTPLSLRVAGRALRLGRRAVVALPGKAAR